MIFWSLSALIWFKNMKKMLLQMTSGFLQLESTLNLSVPLSIKLTQVAKNQFGFATAILWH
jgi:hypothetical protein